MKIIKIEDVEKYTDEEIKRFFDRVVVIPTETVYGLAGRIDNDDILKDIYKIKGRPSNNPLILHVSDLDMLKTVIDGEISLKYKKLIERFWPGPLSLIFKANKNLSNVVRGSSMETVAVRMPLNKMLLRIISIVGVPLAAPSANISGRPSPTEINHVVNDFGDDIETYIDGGPCKFGLESTVFMELDGINYILRPGSVTKEDIEKAVNEPVILKTKADGSKIVSPGTKYTHYSPKVPVFLFVGEKYLENFKKEANTFKNKKIGIMIQNKDISKIEIENAILFDLGDTKEKSASRCFQGLRELENKVDVIFIKGFDTTNEGAAIMDRLEKASVKIIK